MKPLFLTLRLHRQTAPGTLMQPEIAKAIAGVVTEGARRWHYRLHAYVVMQDVVYLLVTPRTALRELTQKLKAATTREANRLLGRTGPFWQRTSPAKPAQSKPEFERMRAFIEWNPVKAGIVPYPESYPWSSARAHGRAAAQGANF